ncbi:tRNA (adenosine(37)-N6)-threonylcarbamoyltransferase complex ATPase subunit type 1 TsaE [candidate division WWE3 bacterium]|uniref:tRNA threonylcarbamoyladenosine biosynthesis protein TsaE n=1 Tax=candidate division WWE3 bacterium TaxID=2053526 RepID=A0A955LHK2_UNCKA|nr:tRNA (adenosine(37)-N6)-threonylcarbamoyltransferase complex ATPase subunit type 1 TsaE [candidate division WWE3 bacterium]
MVTHSPEETQKYAATFLTDLIQSGMHVVALVGDLGSGKTTFVQGLAQTLHIEHQIVSPTFTLLQQYPIAGHEYFDSLSHLDVYRLNTLDEVFELGIEEIFENKRSLVLIEWADKVREILPDDVCEVAFFVQGNEHEIRCEI